MESNIRTTGTLDKDIDTMKEAMNEVLSDFADAYSDAMLESFEVEWDGVEYHYEIIAREEL